MSAPVAGPGATHEAVALGLVAASAATAHKDACELRRRLGALDEADVPGVEAAKAQLHRLLVDIASLRNATELLRRETAQRG